MSVYYTPYQRYPPLPTDEVVDENQLREHLDTASLSRTILIFPNPPSGQPSASPSTPTSASCSTPSFTFLSSGEPFADDSELSDGSWSRVDTPPALPTPWHVVPAPLQPWPPHLAVHLPDRASLRAKSISPSSSADSTFTMTSAVPSEAAAAALAHADACSSIPFLSFFARILGIDPDTLALISLPPEPTESILFPGTSSSEHAPTPDEVASADARPLLLLALPDDKGGVIQEGMRVAYSRDFTPDNPFRLGAPFWGVLTGVLENGRKVWKTVWMRSGEV